MHKSFLLHRPSLAQEPEWADEDWLFVVASDTLKFVFLYYDCSILLSAGKNESDFSSSSRAVYEFRHVLQWHLFRAQTGPVTSHVDVKPHSSADCCANLCHDWYAIRYLCSTFCFSGNQCSSLRVPLPCGEECLKEGRNTRNWNK